MELRHVLNRVYVKERPKTEDLEYLLSLETLEEHEVLFDFADRVRETYMGRGILLRGIVEFLNHCRNTCRYCGLNRYQDNLERFRMSADRYLLKIETMNPELYRELHPEMSHNFRLACLGTLAALGYQTGSGSIVGVKGQSERNLAEDILFFSEGGFSMLGIGPFIPHSGTDMGVEAPGGIEPGIEDAGRDADRDQKHPPSGDHGSGKLGPERSLEDCAQGRCERRHAQFYSPSLPPVLRCLSRPGPGSGIPQSLREDGRVHRAFNPAEGGFFQGGFTEN